MHMDVEEQSGSRARIKREPGHGEWPEKLAKKSRAVYSWVIRLTSLLSSLPLISNCTLNLKLKGMRSN